MTSYSPESECSLVERARRILEAATTLQEQLDSASLPQPTFLVGGRYDWYDASHLPDLLETRLNLLEAAQSIFDLVMGPFDTLLYHSSIMRTKLDVLRTLVELKIAEHVPLEGDVEIRGLAHKLGLDEGLLSRFLKCGYLMGVFRETKDGCVGHTNFSAALPKVSVHIGMFSSPWIRNSAFFVPEAIKTQVCEGKKLCPLELADKENGGRGFWTQLVENYPGDEGTNKFSRGLKILGEADFGRDFVGFSQGFEWEKLGLGSIVDIGGGVADIAVSIAKELTTRKVVVQDLEANCELAMEKIGQCGLQDRVDFQIQDFFDTQSPDLKPAAYLLVRIFHDWIDEDCQRIIRPLLPAMETLGTKLLVAERILSDDVANVPIYKEWSGRLSDVGMFMLFGAKERSRKDWEKLLKKADGRLMIETFKRPASTACTFMQIGLQIVKDNSANEINE